MHALSVLKHACFTALDHDEDVPADKSEFYSVVDPQSVLELVERAERISDEELRALGALIQDLVTYVSLVPDEKGMAKPLDREELIRRARMLRGLTEIQ